MTDTNEIITEVASLLFVIVLLFWTGVFGKNLFNISRQLKRYIAIAGISVSAFFLSAAIETFNKSVSKPYFIFIPPVFLIVYFALRLVAALKEKE